LSFFNELKRRNVTRVVIAYAVAAWVLLQIADLVLENIAAPPWVIQVIMLVMLLGFIASVVIAWAYELTPDGIKRQADIDRNHSITAATGHKLDRIIIGFLALAVVFFIYDKSTPPQLATAEPASLVIEKAEGAPQPSTEPSIAVLPFVNMSTDAEQEYFSDGISEEVLNLLVQVEGLKVASRTSSFTYKGENLDIPEIAAELKVNHILEGSVRKAGNQVRITAQLIDTSNDRHLWSDSYDREMTDIFQIQNEIANAIVSALTTKLDIGLQLVEIVPATSNISAYDLYLEGRELFIARENLPTSWQLLQQATQMDPQFARAWDALAAVESVATSWFPGDGIDHDSLALEAAHRALEIDPGLSMAYAVIGMKHQITGEG
jgi:TolB-like protein